jgi:hypoxanthine phosphoribosyltransferase
MDIKSYDYKYRKGIKEITWEDFGNFTRKLSELLAKEDIDIVIGIARAGLFPATAVSCMLRKEMYPVRLTRRYIDRVVREKPEWKVTPPYAELQGKSLVIIDEITDTGVTLSMVKKAVLDGGARHALTASLAAHTWTNPKPDYSVLETDALILFPWDYHIYQNGKWVIHPEYEEAIQIQKGK